MTAEKMKHLRWLQYGRRMSSIRKEHRFSGCRQGLILSLKRYPTESDGKHRMGHRNPNETLPGICRGEKNPDNLRERQCLNGKRQLLWISQSQRVARLQEIVPQSEVPTDLYQRQSQFQNYIGLILGVKVPKSSPRR